MQRGALNDSVKYYAVSQGVHGGILLAGVLLALQKYWLFLLVGLPVGAFFVFDGVIVRALREYRKLRLMLIVEVAVIWTVMFTAGWLPGGGGKEGFLLIALCPLLWVASRTNKELRRILMGGID
ncbi:MAG: hypothetical protein ACOY3E_13380 [Pseudomonadota bacterium]